MQFELLTCVMNGTTACIVRVMLGSVTLPQSFQKTLNCTARVGCSLILDSPPWEKWLQIMAENLSTTNTSVFLEMIASFTGVSQLCWPLREGLLHTLVYFAFLGLLPALSLFPIVYKLWLPGMAKGTHAPQRAGIHLLFILSSSC